VANGSNLMSEGFGALGGVVTTVDVTDCVPEVRRGDEAVLIGKQGDEEITFEEMADKFASVHTEINLMAGFMNRVTYT
jgi:alanine racemase